MPARGEKAGKTPRVTDLNGVRSNRSKGNGQTAMNRVKYRDGQVQIGMGLQPAKWERPESSLPDQQSSRSEQTKGTLHTREPPRMERATTDERGRRTQEDHRTRGKLWQAEMVVMVVATRGQGGSLEKGSSRERECEGGLIGKEK